jgi:hypothetical protein
MARIRSSSRREQREIRAVSEQGVRPHAPKSNRAAAKTVASEDKRKPRRPLNSRSMSWSRLSRQRPLQASVTCLEARVRQVGS